MGGYTARQPLAGLKVAILGAGKMGGILLQAFLKSKVLEPEQIMATVEHEDRASRVNSKGGGEGKTEQVNLELNEKCKLRSSIHRGGEGKTELASTELN
jgi:hypothetical protein